MRSQVCVDASFIVAMFIPERFSQTALALWREWMLNDWQVIAPMLLYYEVTSAIYRKALSGLITRPDSREALQRFLALDIEKTDPPSLSLRAMELAEKFQRPNTYDAHFLALAEIQDCPFWTGDERLVNAAGASMGKLFWLGHYHERT